MPRQYFIWTIGCQMNEADSRKVAAHLELLGYQATTKPEEADVAVLNTCVVKQQAEERIYGRLGSLKTLKEQRPGYTIALMGCLVGVKEAPRLRKQFPFVDVFMSPSDPAPLVEHLTTQGLHDLTLDQDNYERSLRDAIQDADHVLPLEQRGSRVTAYVPVVLGCSHACSFCIIPYRRGIERSRPMADILREIRGLVDQGVKEIMLLGQIVDRYGLELPEPTDLADLLTAVNAVPGLERLRFLTSHPNWMSDKLLDAVANLDKVCPQLEVPVQAGNDEVLARMRRGYTSEAYLHLIERIRRRLPDAAINTDIIVGFPGETEAQFDDTMRLCAEVGFDKIHISRYSQRPRTVAARFMTDDVPEAEKARRHQVLDAQQAAFLATANAKLLGRTEQVLAERHDQGRWSGRTRHNKLVHFAADGDWLGRVAAVKINKTSAFTLYGELVGGA